MKSLSCSLHENHEKQSWIWKKKLNIQNNKQFIQADHHLPIYPALNSEHWDLLLSSKSRWNRKSLASPWKGTEKTKNRTWFHMSHAKRSLSNIILVRKLISTPCKTGLFPSCIVCTSIMQYASILCTYIHHFVHTTTINMYLRITYHFVSGIISSPLWPHERICACGVCGLGRYSTPPLKLLPSRSQWPRCSWMWPNKCTCPVPHHEMARARRIP